MGQEVGAALGAAWVRLVNSLFASFTGVSLTKAASGLGSTDPGLGAAVFAVRLGRTQIKRFYCKALAHWVRLSPGKMSLRRSEQLVRIVRSRRRIREGQWMSALIGL